MISLKELTHIILAIILAAFVISFLPTIETFLNALLIALVIIGISVIAKKIMAHYLDLKSEIKIWHWQRWGVYERSYFKKPLPVGLIFPFILSWLSWGYVSALTFLQTDLKPALHRVARRRGALDSRFLAIKDWHEASVLGWGIGVNLGLGLILFIISFFFKNTLMLDIAKFSIYYAAWNLVPFGKLDGTRILFGSRYMWYVLWFFAIIFLVIALFFI